MRQSARDAVNDRLDRQTPNRLPLLNADGTINPISAEAERIRDLGLTIRQIEKRDLEHFTDDGLTLAQKRRREEALSYAR